MELVKDAVSSVIDRQKLVDCASELFRKSSGSFEQYLIASECAKIMRDNPESLLVCDALRDAVWEKLNTGHWKDVDPIWRELYALIVLIKIEFISAKLSSSSVNADAYLLTGDLIKMCDMGWMMGAPVLNGAAQVLAEKLSNICQQWCPEEETSLPAKRRRMEKEVSMPRGSDNVTSLETADAEEVDLLRFLTEYKTKERPVRLSGLVSQWPAVAAWDFDFLKRICGFRLVPVELGKRYTDNSWTQSLMTVREFVNNHVYQGADAYLAQHQLLDQVPRLKEDLEVPEFCLTGPEDDEVDANVWFGPAGTVSPLHTDPKHNILCQVVGSKYVRLYCKDQDSLVYPYPDAMLSNTSMVDLERVDQDRFPKFCDAVGFETVLNSGDALYIPPKCWHFVKSLSPSMSVSFWFK